MACGAASMGPGVQVMRLRANVGFGAGHNTVLPVLDSDYHVVVNPDITLDDDAVSKLCAFMDAHPDVVMATPRFCFRTDAGSIRQSGAGLSFAAGAAGSAAVSEGRGTALSDAGRGSVPPAGD